MMDEEVKVPNGSDANLIRKMTKAHKDNASYSMHVRIEAYQYQEYYPQKQNIFAIGHYAGCVPYTVDGFLEKNKYVLAAGS